MAAITPEKSWQAVFNRDPHFGDVLDGLILVDLLHTDRKHLLHFMGKEGLEAFMAYHADAGRSNDLPKPLQHRAMRPGPGPLLRRLRSRRKSRVRAKQRAAENPW